MVLICNDPKFIFLKAKKTAGTSIEMVFEKFCGPPGREITEKTPGLFSKYGVIGHRVMKRSQEPQHELSIFNQHMNTKEVRSVVGASFWDEAIKIGTIRNPYTAAVSLFHWSNHLQKIDLSDKTHKQQKKKFEYWLVRRREIGGVQKSHLNNKYCLDHLIRFETMEEDIRATLKHLGLSDKNLDIPVTKQLIPSESRIPVADMFTPRGIKIIRKRCAWMFEHGGYPEDINECEDPLLPQ